MLWPFGMLIFFQSRACLFSSIFSYDSCIYLTHNESTNDSYMVHEVGLSNIGNGGCCKSFIKAMQDPVAFR